MAETPYYVQVPVPVHRVQDVYRLLAEEEPALEEDEDFADSPYYLSRKKPQCTVETVRGGVILRCLKGPRHGGRHKYVERGAGYGNEG